MHRILNPTGRNVRVDLMGSGVFGASRGRGTHNGVDLLCVPGQTVKAPVDGYYSRIAYPYSDMSYSGMRIKSDWVWLDLFYVAPTIDLGPVKMGEDIGRAEDISSRYGANMQPHIHLRIVRVDPLALMDGVKFISYWR